jgi:hypothetical protein
LIFFIEFLFALPGPAVGRQVVPRLVEADSLCIFLHCGLNASVSWWFCAPGAQSASLVQRTSSSDVGLSGVGLSNVGSLTCEPDPTYQWPDPTSEDLVPVGRSSRGSRATILLGFLDSSARFLLRLTPRPLLPMWIFGFSATTASFAFLWNFRCPDLIPRAWLALDLPNWIFSLSILLKVPA